MKSKFKFTYVIILGIVTYACNEKEFDLSRPNPEQFISMLKDGSYINEAGYQLPDFSMNDIGKFLDYLEDTTEIKEFPTNPISSKYTFPKILNECIMWTIEGIRLEKKYPSLEPSLIDTTTYSDRTGYSRLNNKQLIEVSAMYSNWYNEYQTNPSDLLKRKNLFENSAYKWN